MESASGAKKFAENEARLKLFYRSGEPETTQDFQFLETHRPFTIKESGEIGLGFFLDERASPGQLLLVSNAVVSCACISDDAPYKADSYVHAPKTSFMPQFPRIPPEVHQHLSDRLVELTTSGTSCHQIFELDSHYSNDGNMDGISGETSRPRNLHSWRGGKPGTSASEKAEIEDSDWKLRLWNIVANNAIRDKVRILSQDEPRRVETNDLWGVWQLPSYINHSCTPNCHRMRVGNAMFIRAATDIAAGDELTVPYFDIFDPLMIRDVSCLTFSFRCECRRCMFERSLGKPYDDIQTQIIRLKMQIGVEWESYVKGGPMIKDIDTLLAHLVDQRTPIRKLTRSHKFASCHQRVRKNLIQSDLDKMKDWTEKYWINASFVDCYIASYTICATRSFRQGDPRDPLTHLAEYHIDYFTTNPTEETKRRNRVTMTATEILSIVSQVHPGNMLGQEFSFILLNLHRSDSPSSLNYAESQGIQFCSCYYGYPGTDTLKLLLSTES